MIAGNHGHPTVVINNPNSPKSRCFIVWTTNDMQTHEITIRVRYSETDAMGFLHHSNFLNYFEMGRTELFRSSGGSYRLMEEGGLYLVVVKINVRYKRPAHYDDELTLRTTLAKATPVKLQHTYQLFRGDELLTEGDSTLACVDGKGQITRIPEKILEGM